MFTRTCSHTQTCTHSPMHYHSPGVLRYHQGQWLWWLTHPRGVQGPAPQEHVLTSTPALGRCQQTALLPAASRITGSPQISQYRRGQDRHRGDVVMMGAQGAACCPRRLGEVPEDKGAISGRARLCGWVSAVLASALTPPPRASPLPCVESQGHGGFWHPRGHGPASLPGRAHFAQVSCAQ